MSEIKNFRKTFFSQNSALRVQYNPSLNTVFFSIGKKSNDTWKWQIAKMSDCELGDIINVLDNRSDGISYYHKFNDKETKIWINRKEETVFFKINDFSKPLLPGEQVILKILLYGIVPELFSESERYEDAESLLQNESLMKFMV